MTTGSNDILIGITVPETGKLFNTFGEIIDYLEKTKQELNDIRKAPNFADAMAGDQNKIKQLQQQISGITESFEKNYKATRQASKDKKVFAEDLTTMKQLYMEITDTTSNINSELTSVTATSNETSINFNDLYETMNQNLVKLSGELRTVKTQQLQAKDVKEWKSFRSTVSQTTSNIRELNETLPEIVAAQAQVAKGLAFGFENAPTEQLLQTAEDYNNAIKETPKNYTTINDKVKELDDTITSLEISIRQTSDPQLQKALSERMSMLDKQYKSLLSTMSTDQITQYWDAQKQGAIESLEANEKLGLSQKQLSNKGLKAIAQDVESEYDTAIDSIGRMKGEQVLLARAFRETNDPGVLEIMKGKYDDLTKKIQEQNTWLKEQRTLQRSDLQFGLRNQGAAAIGPALKNIAGVSNSIKSMSETIGINLDKVQLWNTTLSDTNSALGRTTVSLGELVTGIGAIAQRQSETSAQFSNMQNSLKDSSNSIGDWGKSILAQNNAIKAGGGQLTGFQKIMGGFAKGSGFASKALGFMEKGLGKIAPAIQGVQVGFELYDLAMGKSAEQIQKRRDLLMKEAEATIKLNEIIKKGSIGAVNDQIDSIMDEIQAAETKRQSLADNALALTSTWDVFRTVMTETITFWDENTYIMGAAGEEIGQLNKDISEWNRQLELLTRDYIPEAVERTRQMNVVLESGQEAIKNMAKYENDLIDARVEMLEKQTKLENDLNDLQKSYDEETSDAQEKRNEQDKQALKEHLDELAGSETEYNEKVRSMRLDHLRELQKAESDYNSEVESAKVELNENLNDIDTEFREGIVEEEESWREEQDKSNEDYQKRLAKMEEDYNKAKIKRQKDLQEQLFEAELSNDALQFFKLQRQGEKENKEAEEEYNESLMQERKDFTEQQAEKEEQRAKDKADRQQEYEESKAQAIANFQEQQAERQKQYQMDLQQAKDAFAAKLIEEDYAYKESRAKMVRDFEEKQRELDADRAIEDQDRLERLAERRKELNDAFTLELEYYNQREALITSFLGDMNAVKEEYNRLRQGMSGGIDQTERQGYQELVMNELGRLKQIMDSGGTLTTAEQSSYNALMSLSRSFLTTPQDQTIELSAMDKITLGKLIEQQEAIAASIANSEYSNQLEYGSDGAARREIARSGTVYDDIIEENQQYYNDLGLQATEFGYQTQSEINRQASAQQTVIRNRGDETLSELENQTDAQNQSILEGYDYLYTQRRTQEDKDIDALSDHFYDQSQTTQTGLDGQNTILSDSYATQATTQGEGLDTLQTQNSEYLSEMQLLEDEANVTSLEKQQSVYDASITSIDEYGNVFKGKTTGFYQQTLNMIESIGKIGTIRTAIIYNDLSNSMINSAQNALNRINSMGGSSSSSSSSNRNRGSGSGSSGSSNNNNRGGTVGTGNRPGVLAAKGAFINRPTSLIAGEGNIPELVFPFDESKGIPDDIAKKFTREFTNSILPSGTKMLNAMPNNQDGINTRALIGAISKLQAGMNMNIQSIQVGSDITREEIRSQLISMQQTLIEVVRESVS